MSENATFIANLDSSGVSRGVAEIEQILTSGANRVAAAAAKFNTAGATGTGSTFLDKYATDLIQSTNAAVGRMTAARSQLMQGIAGGTLDAAPLRRQVSEVTRQLTAELNAASARAAARGLPVDLVKSLNVGAMRGALADIGDLVRTTRVEANALGKTVGVNVGSALNGAALTAKRQAEILTRAGSDLDAALVGAGREGARANAARLSGADQLREKFRSVREEATRLNQLLDGSEGRQALADRRAALDRQTAALREQVGLVQQVSRAEQQAASGPLRPLRRGAGGRYDTGLIDRALNAVTPPEGPFHGLRARAQAGNAGGLELDRHERALAAETKRQVAYQKGRNARFLLEEQVGEEAIAMERRRILDARQARAVAPAGGGGGGGGRGRGTGTGGATDPFDALLGGLTSRGFDTGNKGFRPDFNGIAGTTGTLIKYAALGSAIAAVTGATGQGTREFLDYTDSLTDVANALTVADGNFTKMRNSLVSSDFENRLQDFSRDAGSNVGEQLDAAGRGVRAFGQISGPDRDSQSRLLQIGEQTAEVATQLKVITGTNIKDQTGNVIAIGQAFDLTADSLFRISDAIANAKNVGGGDFAEVSQGLANFAQPAKEANLQLQEAANLISVVQAKTEQSGRLVATRLSRITSTAQSAGGQATLRGAGIDTQQPLLKQFADLQEKFESGTLSPERQKAITSRLGGTANIREFQVALQEANNVLEQSAPGYAKAGAGADLYNQKNKDLAGQLRQIRGDVKNLFVELGNSQIFATIGVALQAIEPGLKTLNDLLEIYNELPKALRTAIGLTLALAGASRLVGSLQARSGGGGLAAEAVTSIKRNPYAPAVAGGSVAAGVNVAALDAQTAAIHNQAAAEIRNAAAKASVARAEAGKLEIQALSARSSVAYLEQQVAAALTDDGRAAALERLTLMQARSNELDAASVGAQERVNVLEAEHLALIRLQTDALLLNTGAKRTNAVADLDAAAAGIGAAGAGGIGKTTTGAAGIASGVKSNLKLIGGLAALVGLDLIFNKAEEAAQKTTTAISAQAAATQTLGAAIDEAGLGASAESFRGAAAAARASKGSGVFGFVADINNASRGRDPEALAKIFDAQAKDADARAKSLREAQAAAAADPRDAAAAFQDVQSVEGLKAGLEALELAGASAETTIDALTRALGQLDNGSLPSGTVLRGGRTRLEASLFGSFNDSIEGAYLGAVKGRTVQVERGDVNAPENQKLLRRKFLRDKPLSFPGSDTLDKINDLGGIFDGGASDSITLGGSALAREAYYDEFLGEKNADRRKKTNDKFQKTVSDFLDNANVSNEEGGFLDEAQMNDLAKRAAAVIMPKGLVGRERDRFRKDIETNLKALLAEQLDPANLILDQETSNEVQRILVSQAGRRAQDGTVGNANKLGAARNAANKARSEIADGGVVPGRYKQLQEAINQEASLEAEALRPVTGVEAARQQLVDILDAERLAAEKGTDATTETIQAELVARRGLAEAVRAEAQAHANYQKSLLGADDEVGRARADLNESLQQAAFAASTGDVGAQYEALAAANDQANQIRKQTAARRGAALVAALDPRDGIGKADAELASVQLQLAAVTVRGEDGQFTQAYLDLVTQLKQSALAVVQAQAELSNAARSANTNPASQSGQAATAVINAQTTLNASKSGTVAYYQALGQLNEAKLAYARQEESLAEANILSRVPGNDKVARARADLAIATRRRKFEERAANGDYDTSGDLVGQAPDFAALGKGMGELVAEGINENDYKRLGGGIGDDLYEGVASLNYFGLGVAIGQDFANGINSVLDSLTLSGQAERGRTAVRVSAHSGGVSSINNKQVQGLVRGGVVTQQYGNKSSRYSGGVHTGVDIGVKTGTPVHAARAGTVLSASYQGAYGNSITIRGTDGLLYRYGHLSAFAVHKGDTVGRGQVIGRSGNTGNSTGPHLHFEVSKGGTAINPEKYLGGVTSTSAPTKNRDASGGSNETSVVQARNAERDAADAYARAIQERKDARALSKIDPADSLSRATLEVRAAKAAIKLTHKGSTEYYTALTDLRIAQNGLVDAIVASQKNQFLLTIDLTDPVKQAEAEYRAATNKLKRDKANKAGPRVIAQDRLDVRNAKAAREAAIFDQRLSDVQVAEQLGRITHQQYIKYLEGEHDRLTSIAKRTRQQQDELNQIDLLIKGAKESAAGQFNIGDIQLPTIYEVRRYIKATAAGLSYQAQQAPLGFSAPQQMSTTYTTFNIDGADTGFILQLLSQYLGSEALSRLSTTTRKV